MEGFTFYQEEGRPFLGRKLEKMRSFLERQGLDLDEKIQYSVILVYRRGKDCSLWIPAGQCTQMHCCRSTVSGRRPDGKTDVFPYEKCVGRGDHPSVCIYKAGESGVFSGIGILACHGY